MASWVQKSLFTKRCQFLRARARQLARMPNRSCDSPCSRGVSQILETCAYFLMFMDVLLCP